MGDWEGLALLSVVILVFIVPRWRRRRSEKKMDKLNSFGKALPRIVTPARPGGSIFMGSDPYRQKLKE